MALKLGLNLGYFGIGPQGEEAVEIVRAAERTWRIPATTFPAKPSQPADSAGGDGLAAEVRALLGRRA